MILLDANFLYAYYNKQDVHHKRAIELSKELKQTPDELIILDYIFDEVISVSLNRLKNINKVKIIGKDILSSLGISYINEETFQKAWNIFSNQSNTKFSFTDCIIIAFMNIYNIKNLASFDKEFLNIKDINLIL